MLYETSQKQLVKCRNFIAQANHFAKHNALAIWKTFYYYAEKVFLYLYIAYSFKEINITSS